MLENILLSAAYYESFSKFASNLKPTASFTTKQMSDIASTTLEEFYVSAEESGASDEEIKVLGEDLFLYVLSELDNQGVSDENDADAKDLENEIFQGLMEQIEL